MLRSVFWLASLSVFLSAAGQSSPPAVPSAGASQSGPTASSGVTLTTSTQLVVVDVTVLDRSGNPIHGLKASDFTVEEGKKAQVIRNFDEHAAAAASAADTRTKLPALPPSTFTDYEPTPPDSTLNVLLLDALNTPMTDQAYVRYQLKQYVKRAAPGTRIAIFGLGQRLTMLQGFSSDPAILKAAVEHKLIPRASVLLDDAAGTGATPTNLSDSVSQAGAPESVAANLRQFEAQNSSFLIQLRSTYTIAAFKNIGRYLSQFPGRKNLIWFSGAFPLTVFADPDLENPSAVQADVSDDLREASNLLNRARVAVYPVDARGLQTVPSFSEASADGKYARNPGALGKDIGKFSQTNNQEHFAMDQIADDTGGHAFYNTNDLASAVTNSIAAGSSYYTLTYTPTERKTNGEYRGIKVRLRAESSAHGGTLSYRHGYYSAKTSKRQVEPVASAAAPDGAVSATALPEVSRPLNHSAMDRGAPTLSEVLFKVRVLRAAGDETVIAEENKADAKGPMKGPFRRYLVDFAALGSDLKLNLEPDGHRSGDVEFLTYVYDGDGTLLNAAANNLHMNLGSESYGKLLRSGVGFHQEISVPARGESFLRIGVYDIPSGRVGVVEVPTSSVGAVPLATPGTVSPAAATTDPQKAPK